MNQQLVLLPSFSCEAGSSLGRLATSISSNTRVIGRERQSSSLKKPSFWLEPRGTKCTHYANANLKLRHVDLWEPNEPSSQLVVGGRGLGYILYSQVSVDWTLGYTKWTQRKPLTLAWSSIQCLVNLIHFSSVWSD